MPADRLVSGRKTTLRDEQKQATRERLKDAGLNVFAEHGYRKATIDLIAAEAGASRTTLYLHFDSKASLLAAMFEDMITVDFPEYYRALDDALATGQPGPLREWLRSWLDWLSEHRRIVNALDEAIASGWDMTKVSTDVLPFMPQYTERWSGREPEANGRLVLLTMTLLMGMERALEVERSSGEERQEPLLLDLLADVFAAALRPHDP